MWRRKKTYLRLLHDVYRQKQKGGVSVSAEGGSINAAKLRTLVEYLKQYPKRLPNVCRTLYHNIKKTYCRKRKKQKRTRVLEADLLIFKELCTQCTEEGVAAVIGLYFSRSIEVLLSEFYRRHSSPDLLSLVFSSFQCYADSVCATRQTVEVTALAGMAVEASIYEPPLRAEDRIPTIKASLLLLAITTLSKAGEESLKPHIATLSGHLFHAFNNHKMSDADGMATKSRPPLLQESLATLCASPAPAVFARVVSAFLQEFNNTHWMATDTIDHILEALIRVASDKLSHQTKISCALLTHLRNTLADSSLLFHSSASKSCVFTPSIGRVVRKLSLGSEQSQRQFVNKCTILKRLLQFSLTTLKFEHSFQRVHPYRSLFEQDWDNLLAVVVFCVKHEDKRAGAQILHSSLSEVVHKNAVALRHLICTVSGDAGKSGSGSLVPYILHLVLECMHEIIASSSKTGMAHAAPCGFCSAQAVHKILTALDRNDSTHYNLRGSVLSRKIRVMLLFYLNAVTEWVSSLSNKRIHHLTLATTPPVSLLGGLSSAQLCQVCAYARSGDRGTQHLAGMFLQRLIESQPPSGGGSRQLLGTAMATHTALLPVQLVRNTIFNVLVRRGESKQPGCHGLRVILAWELQKKMIQAFSTVELLSSLPMIFSLESFWKTYAIAKTDAEAGKGEVDRHEEEIKHELLRSLVTFVCAFFRFADKELCLQGELVRNIELFGHLDRFGSTLLYENDCLIMKPPSRRVDSRTNYQLPKPMQVEEISAYILQQAVSPLISEQERSLATKQVHSSYTPVESPYQLLLKPGTS